MSILNQDQGSESGLTAEIPPTNSLKLEAAKSMGNLIGDLENLDKDPSAKFMTVLGVGLDKIAILNLPIEIKPADTSQQPNQEANKYFIVISSEPSSAGIYAVEANDNLSKQSLADYLDQKAKGKDITAKFQTHGSNPLNKTTFNMMKDPKNNTSTLQNPVFVASKLPNTPDTENLFIEALRGSQRNINEYRDAIALAGGLRQRLNSEPLTPHSSPSQGNTT